MGREIPPVCSPGTTHGQAILLLAGIPRSTPFSPAVGKTCRLAGRPSLEISWSCPKFGSLFCEMPHQVHSTGRNVRGVPAATTDTHHGWRSQCPFVFLVWKKGPKHPALTEVTLSTPKQRFGILWSSRKRNKLGFPISKGAKNQTPALPHLSTGKPVTQTTDPNPSVT